MYKPRFLIYCPVGVKTGGPEALYQLGAMLKELGYDCLIIPSIETQDMQTASDFLIYNMGYLKSKKIKSSDVLITPNIESLPSWLIKRVKNPIVMWWLSVDNSPHPFFRNFEVKNFAYHVGWNLFKDDSLKSRKPILRFMQLILGRSQNTIMNSMRSRIRLIIIKLRTKPINLENCTHIAQSYYAKNIVEHYFRTKVQIVSDYTDFNDNSFLKLSNKILNPAEKMLISFNPYKGKEFLDTIISLMPPQYKFIPIKNMSTSQVRETLQKSSLYLDLGHFPGRDRIPCEAILSGTPVILALRGAARNLKDYKLSSDYKIDLELNGPSESKEIIEAILRDYKNIDQSDFLNQQLQSRHTFKSEVIEFIENWNVLSKRV
jgi:hypothetical protein